MNTKWIIGTLSLAVTFLFVACKDDTPVNPISEEPDDFGIEQVTATYDPMLEQIIMSIKVSGQAGSTRPDPAGQLDKAPVLGYVFPTTLSPTDVGFGNVKGIVAMAVTSHPDFDDTPLWDENLDNDYENDGYEWHAHWVVLEDDQRVEGGLSVKQFDPNDKSVILPPTNPGMPMYMDSPGFQIVRSNHTITVVIPKSAVNHQVNFRYDGVTAAMRVNTSDASLPMLGVYEVFDVASGNLSLPYVIGQ